MVFRAFDAARKSRVWSLTGAAGMTAQLSFSEMGLLAMEKAAR